MQQEILSSEYTLAWQEPTYLAALVAGYQAPNRAHNLRTGYAFYLPLLFRNYE